MRIVAFYIPRELGDLEKKPDDTSECTRYFVECVMDVSQMSEAEQVSTLQAILNEMGTSRGSAKGSGPIGIFDSSKFDALYSYVKNAEHLTRESKFMLGNELPQLLKKLCKQVAHILSRRAAGLADTGDRSPALEIDADFDTIARSALKMYCFLICNLILRIESPPVQSHAGNLTTEGSSQQTPVASRSRHRSRGTNALGASGETLCMDLSAKELALTALLDVLSSDLDQIWSKSMPSTSGAVPLEHNELFEDGSAGTPQSQESLSQDRRAHVDDAVLQLIFNIVLRMMTTRSNLFESANSSSRKEDLTAVGHVMHMLLLAVGHRLISFHDINTNAQLYEEALSQVADSTAHQSRSSRTEGIESRRNLAQKYFRTCSVTPSMREDFLSPVGELMIKYEFVAKYVAFFIQTINFDGLQQEDKPLANVSSGENLVRSESGTTATSDRQPTGTADPERMWPIRLVRAIFETVTEYCGIVPDIVEDTAAGETEDIETVPVEEGKQETPHSTEDSNEISDAGEVAEVAVPVSPVVSRKRKHWKIVYMASSHLTVDAGSCKNLVSFFDVFTENSVAIVARNFDLLKPLLTNCENYDIRKSVVSSLVEIIQEKFSKVSRLKAQVSKNSPDRLSSEMEMYKHECELYVELLNLLLARLMDVSSVVRTHSIKGFTRLWEKKVMPLPYQLKLLERVVLRLDDRNNHTRKAAFGFVSTVIANNSFTSKYLSLKRLQSRRAAIEKQMEAIDVDTTIDEGNDTAALGISGDSPTNARSSHIGMNEFSSMAQDSSVLEDADGEFGRQDGPIESLSQKKLKMKFYNMGIRFIENIHRAIEVAFVMLRSRVLADVLESIDLISKANELRVDIATKESYKMFPLIYSDEAAVQEAIRSAFGNMLFVQFRNQSNIPLVYRNIACIKNFMQLLANCEEEIIAAIESICEHLASQKNMQPVITDDILSVIWGISHGETVLMKGGMMNRKEREEMGLVEGELSDLRERRYAMQLYSILVLAHPRHVKERIPEIVQKLLPEWSSDNIICCYLFRSLQRLSSVKSFSLVPVSDPLMDLVAQQIVRPSENLETWMMMAERGLSLVSSLCDTPSEAFDHIMKAVESYMLAALPEGLSEWLLNQEHMSTTASVQMTDEDAKRARVALTQFVFLLGHCVMKQYIHIDNWERSALNSLEVGNEYRPLFRQASSAKIQHKEGKKKTEVTDTMEKELGFDSKEYKREEIREIAENGREGLAAQGSMTHKYLPALTKWVGFILQHPSDQANSGAIDCTMHIMKDPYWRTACILTLEKLMIISESVCKQNIRLLFTILKQCPEWWIRTNCLIGMSDLLCTHPNVVQPYLHPSEGHTTALLDPSTDPRVRYTALTLYIHLALNDMLRIPEMTPYLLCLIGDDDVAIAKLGVNFLHELHSKNKNMVYNLLPVICMHMCKVYENNEEKFFESIRIIMEKIEKDKQAEAIVDKLCSKYPTFSAHGTTSFDLVVARYLTFCLSELNYANDRVVLRLCSETNFQYYKRWMIDSQVRRYFTNIVTKVRRSGHGTATVDVDKSAQSQTTSAKVGSDRRSRVAVLDDWESRVKSFLQRNMENTAGESEVETKSTSIQVDNDQPDPIQREKPARLIHSESDE